ncbi:hypothetical protein ES703_115608 [subsurface metagenome]
MAEIRVNRPCDVVWRIFTDPTSWKIWWGGVLKRVNPGWQLEAILEWKNGDRSRVCDFLPAKRIGLEGRYGEVVTWSFTTGSPESTVVVMEAELSGSTLRETSPGALEIEFQSALDKLKKYVESIPES